MSGLIGNCITSVFPAVAEGFDADLDSPAYAAHWGGLPADFAGVVVNLRATDREGVDAAFERATGLGAQVLRSPYDTFWERATQSYEDPDPSSSD